jgi:hypothetical protein
MQFQSFFMLMTFQPLALASLYSACGNLPTLVSGQALGRAVGILALGVVVQDKVHQTCPAARLRVFKHLPVPGRVAESRARPPASEKVDVLRLSRKIVVKQELRFPNQYSLVTIVLSVLGLKSRADDVFRRNAVRVLRIRADEALPASSDNVGLVAIGAEIVHDVQHRLVHHSR